MKSVGEVMAIGRTIHESLQKALRGLETGLSGFNMVDRLVGASHEVLKSELAKPTPDRLHVAATANRDGPEPAANKHIAGDGPGICRRPTGKHSGGGEAGRQAPRK